MFDLANIFDWKDTFITLIIGTSYIWGYYAYRLVSWLDL
jgi:hypothetical protein